MRYGEAITALLLCAVIGAITLPAVKIVTPYETVQGMMKYMGFAFIAQGLVLVFFGFAGRTFTGVLAAMRSLSHRSNPPCVRSLTAATRHPPRPTL